MRQIKEVSKSNWKEKSYITRISQMHHMVLYLKTVSTTYPLSK